MIMQKEYLDDVKEHVRNMPEDEFTQRGITRESVLGSKETMEALWFAYQKDVEDYDCDTSFALQDAVAEVLGPLPMRSKANADTEAEPVVDNAEMYLLSWNDECLDIRIECGPMSAEDIKTAMRDKILTRLVELDVVDNAEEAESMYAAAEQAARDKTDEEPYELHVCSDGASISYDSYEERYQIKEYKPAV